MFKQETWSLKYLPFFEVKAQPCILVGSERLPDVTAKSGNREFTRHIGSQEIQGKVRFLPRWHNSVVVKGSALLSYGTRVRYPLGLMFDALRNALRSRYVTRYAYNKHYVTRYCPVTRYVTHVTQKVTKP